MSSQMVTFSGASAVLLASRMAWAAATPAVGPVLRARVRSGREDPDRLGERLGYPSVARPLGPLCWVHAASLGEARSVEPIIRRLVEDHGMDVLMTTVTVTSARAMAQALPPRARHQFAPLDRRSAVDRFLEHWRPDCALRVESEIWPETLSALTRRRIPRAIVQARLSARSATRWRWLGGALRQLLDGFDPVIAQTTVDRKRLANLGVAHLQGPFNLKADAGVPESDPASLAALQNDLGQRPLWLAASTHPGEETIALDAHARLSRRWPDLLTILLPRHPDRGDSIEAQVRKCGLTVRRRSLGVMPGDANVYVADTLGETGLFYRLAPVALVGGTLAPRGGHNLLEPAQLDCAILHGPDVANVVDVATELKQAGAATEVVDADTLAGALSHLLEQPAAAERMASAAKQVATRSRGVTTQVTELLGPMIAAAKVAHART
ncbi:MAG: 3-deoxy-D-manno-octulosonic acid transferase [Rhodospirillales bacterium]|nr:3-deoxy-D-manno-octulosonic acid transferase [Rhodospirillales bacterium]